MKHRPTSRRRRTTRSVLRLLDPLAGRCIQRSRGRYRSVCTAIYEDAEHRQYYPTKPWQSSFRFSRLSRSALPSALLKLPTGLTRPS